MKDFRVLNTMDTTMESTNQSVLVAELSTVEYINLGNMFDEGEEMPHSFGADGDTYVVAMDSSLSNEIIRQARNEGVVSLNEDEFRFREEYKEGRKQKIFYHNDVNVIGLPRTDTSLDAGKVPDELREKLESVFYDFMDDYSTGMAIAKFEFIKGGNAVFYAVAKNPNEEMYYGVVEDESFDGPKLTGMDIESFKLFKFVQDDDLPFNVHKYIVLGKKAE